MSIEQISNNDALASHWHALKASKGQIVSLTKDIKRLHAEIQKLDGFETAADDSDKETLSELIALAEKIEPTEAK